MLSPNTTITVPLSIGNVDLEDRLRGFQFEIGLPDGVSPVLVDGEINGNGQCNQNAPDFLGICALIARNIIVVAYASREAIPAGQFGSIDLQVETIGDPRDLSLEIVTCATDGGDPQVPPCTGNLALFVEGPPALAINPDTARFRDPGDDATFTVSNVLSPGNRCSVGVAYRGGGAGGSSTLRVSTDTADTDPATVSATLRIAAPEPPSLALSPPGATVSQPGETVDFTVSNEGGEPLSLSAIGLDGSESFEIIAGDCRAGVTTLESDTSCIIVVSYLGDGDGSSATLRVQTDTANASPASVAATLDAIIQTPLGLDICPTVATFINTGETTKFSIYNIGGENLTVDDFRLVDGEAFSIVGGSCQAGISNLGSDGACSVTVEYTGSDGDDSDLLIVSTDTPGADPGSVRAQLNAIVGSCGTPLGLDVDGREKAFPMAGSIGTVTVRNASRAPFLLWRIALEEDTDALKKAATAFELDRGDCPDTLDGGESCELALRYLGPDPAAAILRIDAANGPARSWARIKLVGQQAGVPIPTLSPGALLAIAGLLLALALTRLGSRR